MRPKKTPNTYEGGRKVQGVSRYDPWCELETDEVSEQSHYVAPGHFRVKRIGQTLIRDYHARLPVLGFGCNELLFQETTLWMDRRTSPQVRYLRCFAPYANCRFGPPLSPRQIQAVLGPKLTLAPGRGGNAIKSNRVGAETPAAAPGPAPHERSGAQGKPRSRRNTIRDL